MAMSDLKQRIYKQELAKMGFPNAEYKEGSGKIKIEPKNDRMPDINSDGDIRYSPEYGWLVNDTIRPVVDRVNEITAAWEHSRPVPMENLSRFNILTEFNNIVLAARDDGEYRRGLHFVVWEYDSDRTGFHAGHYTDDYAAAKENFALRAGLIQQEKVVTKEVAADIKAAIDFSLENCQSLAYAARFTKINDDLCHAYPEILNQNGFSEHGQAQTASGEPAKKPKQTLQAKLDNAKQKAAAQGDTQKNGRGEKTKKTGERE